MPSDTPTICLPDTTARLALFQIFQLLMGRFPNEQERHPWRRQRGDIVSWFGENTPCRFCSDDYAVDTDLREIRRGTVRISAGPQVFDLLVDLIRNRHRVVSKDDLLGAVWQGRIRIRNRP